MTGLDPKRLRRILGAAVLVVVLCVAWMLGPAWFSDWYSGLSRDGKRSAMVRFHRGVLVAYAVVVVLGPIVGGVATARVLRARKRRQSRPIAARVALLCSASLLGLLLLEAAAGLHQAWNRRPPAGSPRVPHPRMAAQPGDPNELVILVLGESSAKGDPYHKWLSVGKILAWQVERANPGRSVRLEMGAFGGATLEPMLDVLAKQTRRPDAVLVFSGHNEFQSRFTWERAVDYYVDDATHRPPLTPVERVGNWTPLCRMVRDAIDRQYLDMAPTPKMNSDLVDRPAFTAAEYADLRDQFAQQLEAVAAWCDRAGSLPIFILPGANDAGFEPNRSMLAPDVTLPRREAFAREFTHARGFEASDPARAESEYRRLIQLHPGFAETHFRLARLLQARGAVDEARRHYQIARDRDGMPIKCPSDFQAAYRAVAARHDLVLVDAPAVLARLSPTGLLDDHVFHDAMHPTLPAYLALMQDAIDQLRKRKAFGLHRLDPAPIEAAECARHFGMNPERWREVCVFTALFWKWLAITRYDPVERLAKSRRYEDAAHRVGDGLPPDEAGVPGLGLRPGGKAISAEGKRRQEKDVVPPRDR